MLGRLAKAQMLRHGAKNLQPEVFKLSHGTIIHQNGLRTGRLSAPGGKEERRKFEGSKTKSRFWENLGTASTCLSNMGNRASWRGAAVTLFLHRGCFRFSLTHALAKNSISSKFRCLRRDSPLLLSPFAVSILGQAPYQAQNLSGSFLFSPAGPYLLFDVQVCIPKTPAVSTQVTQARLATCEVEYRVFK
jgi:hypothetical protein